MPRGRASERGRRDLGAGPVWSRRAVIAALSAAGIGSLVFRRALAAEAEGRTRITEEMIARASWISGEEFTPGERALMLSGINDLVRDFERIRKIELDNAVPPAVRFAPLRRVPGETAPPARGARPAEPATRGRPQSDEDLAFLPLSELSALVRDGAVSATELVELYLERLQRYDPLLHCVITLTPELAREQARRADEELARGRYRGPLHGIPWGAKDLISVPGYRTTWGARPYRDQVRAETATVAARLADAGAVLAAKTSVGALAWGDVWFGGKTRNPWNPEQGSSGSSAGSAAATAAGLLGFALGTETWGSIVSPCTRCGVTGLRPTFGRVSRHGVMALSWTMDKVGVIARSAEDCALVFDAIHGADGLDPTAVTRPFRWPPTRDPRTLTIGVVRVLFDTDRTEQAPDEQKERLAAWQRNDLETLETLRRSGMKLVDIELPQDVPVDALSFILTAEAATAFDELTRSGRDDELVRQEEQAWPNVFRQGQMIPAVEYLRANRLRTLLMRALERTLREVDVFVAPSFGGDHLLMTNLTGHPAVVVPNGFASGTPTSITFTGRLDGEENLLAVAHAYQQVTTFHLQRPPLDRTGTAGASSSG